MHSRRSSHEWRRARAAQKSENESNDNEEASSQSFAGDSGSYSYKSNKIKQESSTLSTKERRTDDETDDCSSNVLRRKRISSKKKDKSKIRESIKEVLSEDVYSDKDEDSSLQKKNKKRRKSTNKSDNYSRDSTAEKDSPIRKNDAKNKKNKRHVKEKSIELPITEILKKTEEHHTKYEDPIPLPELTTDTIYVQGRSGFSAMKIPGNSKHSRRNFEATPISESKSRPIKVAIIFQKIWCCIGFITQGLLGGIGLLHIILMEIYFDNSTEFVNSYSSLSEVYTSIFSFLIAICIIASFDKFDLAHIGKEHLSEIFQYHYKSILAVPLYIAAFSLHQVSSKMDNKLTLNHYNSSNIVHYLSSFNDTNDNFDFNELQAWQRISLSKNSLVVLGWIFVSFDNRKDMLLAYLETMNKYVDDLNSPT